MKRLFGFLILIAGMALTGCDYQRRTVYSDVNPADLINYIDDLSGGVSTAGSGSASKLSELRNDPETSVKFAQWEDGYSPMGSLRHVADLDWAGLLNINAANLKGVRIYLFHRPAGDDLLVIQTSTDLNTWTASYFSATNSSDYGYVQDGAYDAILSGSKTLAIESLDVDGDDLAADIQLKIYSADGDTYYGKVSNMEGFLL